MTSVVRELQPLKASGLIVCRPSGNVTCCNDEQDWKALSPMVVTAVGKAILSSLLQPLKLLVPTDLKVDGSVTDLSFAQSANKFGLKVVIPSGTTAPVSDEQPLNARVANDVIVAGSDRVVRPVQ